jgi:hypothetical protein
MCHEPVLLFAGKVAHGVEFLKEFTLVGSSLACEYKTTVEASDLPTSIKYDWKY